MPRPKLFPLLIVALSLGLAACGGGSKLLSGTTAKEINSNLEEVSALVAQGDCSGADAAVAEVKSQVDELQDVDSRLKRALEEGAGRLEEVVSGCEEIETEGEETEPLEATEESEEKSTRPEKSEKEEKTEREPSQREPKTPEQNEQTTPEKQEETPPAEESELPSGGVGPSTPAGEG